MENEIKSRSKSTYWMILPYLSAMIVVRLQYVVSKESSSHSGGRVPRRIGAYSACLTNHRSNSIKIWIYIPDQKGFIQPIDALSSNCSESFTS